VHRMNRKCCACVLPDDVDTLWVKAKECGNVVTSAPAQQVGRQCFDVEKAHREREEEEECRRALREHDIPSYFDSDVAACFMSKQDKQVYMLRAVSVSKIFVEE